MAAATTAPYCGGAFRGAPEVLFVEIGAEVLSEGEQGHTVEDALDDAEAAGE